MLAQQCVGYEFSKTSSPTSFGLFMWTIMCFQVVPHQISQPYGTHMVIYRVFLATCDAADTYPAAKVQQLVRYQKGRRRLACESPHGSVAAGARGKDAGG